MYTHTRGKGGDGKAWPNRQVLMTNKHTLKSQTAAECFQFYHFTSLIFTEVYSSSSLGVILLFKWTVLILILLPWPNQQMRANSFLWLFYLLLFSYLTCSKSIMTSSKSWLEGKVLKASTTFTFLPGWGMEIQWQINFPLTEWRISRLLTRGSAGERRSKSRCQGCPSMSYLHNPSNFLKHLSSRQSTPRQVTGQAKQLSDRSLSICLYGHMLATVKPPIRLAKKHQTTD